MEKKKVGAKKKVVVLALRQNTSGALGLHSTNLILSLRIVID